MRDIRKDIMRTNRSKCFNDTRPRTNFSIKDYLSEVKWEMSGVESIGVNMFGMNKSKVMRNSKPNFVGILGQKNLRNLHKLSGTKHVGVPLVESISFKCNVCIVGLRFPWFILKS